CQQYNSDPRTF
nr:immunoglobulin light chain junction region [Macaca mulatta]MOV77648.1 immunoglobulin light chain junction region [Macaca mulatta]MOV77762.1 immunoglobulin light chain junction region [Macaca mulatta]MOV77767.1 immunoglobulin light chain junction region [Macaca mulatta]MOV77799.1 immunoglobulin light chain junction region [Macaca mulatta]